MWPSRSASGAAPRANSANTASPSSPAAVARRSHWRTSSAWNSWSRRLWISRSRSNRASAESRDGSIASIAARCALSASISREDGLALRVAERVVEVVDPEVRRQDRVVPEDPPHPRLDEVVEARIQGPGVGGGTGTRQVDRWQQRCHVVPPARPVRARAWRRPGQAAVVAGSPAGLGRVPCRTSSTVSTTRSTSAAVIPRWVTARIEPLA